MVTRKPKGYQGINHVTSGGDILSVLDTINLPEMTLGRELAGRLKNVKLDDWYPVGDFLDMLEKLDQKLGAYHLRQVGWTIVNKFAAPMIKQHYHNARDLLGGFDTMYHSRNKGTAIGGWKVLSFELGRAEIEKTTPHHCLMEEGICEESLRAIGVPAKVTQSKCFRKGADCCVFVIETSCRDERWWGSQRTV